MDRLEFQRNICAAEGGRILNIGAETDPAGLKARFGAVNLDINRFNCTDIMADARALPFADKSFNLVVCGDVLEHITDYWTAIREAGRVGKIVAATIPSLEYEQRIGHRPAPYPYSDHVWKPVHNEVVLLFPSAEIQEIATPLWYGFFILWELGGSDDKA